MRVMIVDDNPEKIRRLTEHLVEACGLRRDDDISVALTAYDARKLLRDHTVDLLVLDILLPMRAGDSPAQATAIDLLRDLTERQHLRRPKQIVGLTAYVDVAREVEPIFSGRLWTVITYDSDSEVWLKRIERCVSYMQDAERQPAEQTYKTDLCVLTAIYEPETIAIERLPWAWQPPEPLDDCSFFRRGEFTSGEQKFTVASIVAPRMGMVASALTAAKAIDRLRPRFAVMAGICAGVRGKIDLGSVILADPSWDYQSGKRTRDTENTQFSIDPHHLPVSGFVRVRAEQLRNDKSTWRAIRDEWSNSPPTELKLMVGPMASGSAVLADGQVVTEIREQQRKLLGIEMEVYGLYAAASLAGFPRPTAFALKSVCDFADEQKDDSMQQYAAYTSAATVKLFFERYMHEIHAFAGT
jgi:nucleoside phosphorylase